MEMLKKLKLLIVREAKVYLTPEAKDPRKTHKKQKGILISCLMEKRLLINLSLEILQNFENNLDKIKR